MNKTSGYESPALTEIGTLHDLTLQFNKVGSNPDAIDPTAIVVGSLKVIP
jgi:hypothetical protein